MIDQIDQSECLVRLSHCALSLSLHGGLATMPTMYELSQQQAQEVEVVKKDNHSGIRSKGAVFIREPGKKLPPYIQAQKNKKRAARQAEEDKAYRKHQEASAQGQRAMILMELKKQGIEGEEAERIAEEKYQESIGVRKTKAQKEFEMRVNTEAEKIFTAWDDDGDGSLNPAELRQALTLAGFNTVSGVWSVGVWWVG